MIQLGHLYAILARVAKEQRYITYGELSDRYLERTEEWHEPHGTWDEPLGELNRTVDEAGWPAISAVVVLKETKEPGGKFWGSSPNVPTRPRDEVERVALYGHLLGQVHAAPWPESIPTEPPTKG